MTNIPVRRRINVDITEEQYRLISSKLPQGLRQAFFAPIIEDICELLTKFPEQTISAVISRRVHLWQMSKTAASISEEGDNG